MHGASQMHNIQNVQMLCTCARALRWKQFAVCGRSATARRGPPRVGKGGGRELVQMATSYLLLFKCMFTVSQLTAGPLSAAAGQLLRKLLLPWSPQALNLMQFQCHIVDS